MIMYVDVLLNRYHFDFSFRNKIDTLDIMKICAIIMNSLLSIHRFFFFLLRRIVILLVYSNSTVFLASLIDEATFQRLSHHLKTMNIVDINVCTYLTLFTGCSKFCPIVYHLITLIRDSSNM